MPTVALRPVCMADNNRRPNMAYASLMDPRTAAVINTIEDELELWDIFSLRSLA